MEPFLIYVSGPLSADTPEERKIHYNRAMRAGHRIIDRGHFPIIPHALSSFQEWCEENIGGTPDYELYMAWDFAMIKRCSGLLYLAPSPGADRELAYAEELGLPIWYDVASIPFNR